MSIKSTDRPESGDQFNKAEHAGRNLIFEVLEYVEAVPTQEYGDQPAVRVNILDMTTEETFERTLLFGTVLVDRLKGEAGSGDQSVYVIQKPVGKRYWTLASVDDDALVAAAEYVAKNPTLFTVETRTPEAATTSVREALEKKLAEAQSK